LRSPESTSSTPLEDPPPQIHDFNPGVTQNGLFWTSIVPDESVQVDLNGGTATLEVHDLHMKDYFDIVNAVIGGGEPPAPSVVSYRVEWTAVGPVNVFDNVAQQFRGELRNGVFY
jgi:hypothetical protein